MMQIKPIGLILALITVLCLTACRDASVSAASSPAPSVSSGEASPTPGETTASPEPTSVWTRKVTAKSYRAEDGTVILKANYVFPEQTNPDAAGIAVNAFFDQQLTELIRYLEGDLHDAAQSDYQMAKDQSQFTPYEDDQDYSITYESSNLICFLRKYYSYSGGAHGNTAVSGDIFRLDSGRHLGIADFFTVDAKTYKERLFSSILKQADATSDLLFEDYRTKLAECFDPDNFYLSKDGFVFYFQPYEIGPYASGVIEFNIPFDNVKDIMVQWN